MLENFGVTEDNWREAGKKDPHFLQSETPLFVGRAVAALAADPDVLAFSGDVLSSWELARHYGFTDADARQPDWGKYMPKICKSIGFDKTLNLIKPIQRHGIVNREPRAA